VAQFVGDHLVDLAAWAATTAWPWLTAGADLVGALWNAHAGLAWLCLSVPAALLLLLPAPPLLRGASAVLLLSAFLAQAPRPAWGELQLQMFDMGASRTVLLQTSHHQLLAGTGESFGSAGRRFETRILPTLLRGGGAGLDLWLLQKPDRDALRAVTLGHARMAVHETLVVESQRAPPELAPCSTRDWSWDGVRFSIDATADGCWLRARVGSHVLQLAPERAGARIAPGAAADVWILPRRADDARRVLQDAPASTLLLAGLSANEWQSSAWRQLKQEQSRDTQLVSTAQGSIRVTIAPQAAPALAQRGQWQPGIWSASRSRSRCQH
jgi:hypothetical protein